MQPLIVIGGGLAGTEAAWQAAQRGIRVQLYEMRPVVPTPAHVSAYLAELVCSNSLGSDLPDRAPGLLKAELRRLSSLILACAQDTRLPAGGALAVGREAFAALVTRRIEQHPLIELCRQQVTTIPAEGVVVVATGPLTSDALSNDIARLAGQQHLFFFDAMAPIVTHESIDLSRAFHASRYDKGQADYINCPLDQDQYYAFVEALTSAETILLHDFEAQDERFFEACLPLEVLARRGVDALAFGPLRPVGLTDPRTGKRPFAVVQLRQDNLAATLYNLVGFQTNLKWSEQARVFRTIPGLERAEFVRFGQMHRNTFINSPQLLTPGMEFRTRPGLFFAGQITGTEGYVGSAASGLVAGINAARRLWQKEPLFFPSTTMLGALCDYVSSADADNFQPMKANFGLLPPLERPVRQKRARYQAYAQRALDALEQFLQQPAASLTPPEGRAMP
ncbi:MAG: methylenetetrahydrofolate--tRNA-(uracil(54)-C(5))-methyltransferase (FADH(2)-oxidizing) TrmFO [Chloroflexota bacterium]